MKKMSLFLGLLFSITLLMAQNETSEIPKNVKTGWTFGALPAVAFDSDLGLNMAHW